MPLQLDILMPMDHQIMLCSISIFYYEMHSTLLLLIMLRQWICAKIIFQIASSNIMYSWGYLFLCLIDRRGHECNVYHCVNKISVFGNFDINVLSPQSTEVFYLDDGEPKIGPIEKVYVTTLVTPMGLASSFNGGILKIIAKKWANFENSINHHKNGLVWCM